MVDKEAAMQTKFHSFLKQRNSKTNGAMQEAQRLVNLYRVLNDFGPNFMDEYNVMLQNSSDEVQMALKALVGGQEVRNYLEFLQLENNQKKNTNDSTNTSQQTGWLPSPDTEKGMDSNTTSNAISSDEWQSFVARQEEKLAQIVNDLRAEQTQALTRLMDQLSSSLQVKKQATTVPSPKQTPSEYSEIIEEKK